MSLYAYTLSDCLLAKCGQAERAIQRTHKDCTDLKDRYRRRFLVWKRLYQLVHPACISLSLRALEFSGYDTMLMDYKNRNAALEQELEDRKIATDELEVQFELDYDELLRDFSALTKELAAMTKRMAWMEAMLS